jgi:hypothetical protein
MTKKFNENFVSQRERRCPFCGSKDVDRTFEEDFEDGSCIFELECNTCEDKYQEIYEKRLVYSDFFTSNQTLLAEFLSIVILDKKE